MPESKPRPSEADIFRAAFGLGQPSPAALGATEPPAAPPAQPPDFGGGERGKAPGQAPTMDDVLRAAAMGQLRGDR